MPRSLCLLARLAIALAFPAVAGCGETHAVTVDASSVQGDATNAIDASIARAPDAPVVSAHTLRLRVLGGGTVVGSDGTSCVRGCETMLASETTLTLDARADAGWALLTFEGDCAGAHCVLTMDRDHDVVARFASAPSVALGFAGTIQDLAATRDGGVWLAGGDGLATRLAADGHVLAVADTHGIASAAGIASDGEGAWVVGALRGIGTFEGITTDASTRFSTFFVARLAPDGSVSFARALHATTNGSCRAIGIAPDASVTVACTFDRRLVLTRFAENGDLVWSRTLGAIGLSVGVAPVSALEVDARGDVFLAGTFDGVANLGGADLHAAAQEDLFVARYDGRDGAHVWSRRLGAADPYGSVEGATGLVLGPSGDPFVVALLAAHAESDGADLGAPHDENAALVRLDAGTGHVVSSHFFGGEFALAVDASRGPDALSLVAMSRAEVVLGARTIASHSVFALALDEDGAERAVNALALDEDGAGTEWGAIAATPDGSAWMAAPVWRWTPSDFGTFTLDTDASRTLLVRVALRR